MIETIVNQIFGVFDAVGEWIVAQLATLTTLFWSTNAEGGQLTFLGVLALLALGISVIFLMIRVVQNFLHFRG